MQRRKFTSGLASGCLSAGGAWALVAAATAATATAITAITAEAAGVTESDAALGVRAVLDRGASAAVSLLGRQGGFLDNPKVRISLPGFLADAGRLLQFAGQQQKVDDLVTGMNRAAEAAVPEARALLTNAVRAISIEDARQIVTGGENAVSQFFAAKTRAPLNTKFLPIVTRVTERLALTAKYDAVAGKAASFGLVKPDDAQLSSYVTGRALDGLFSMIGEEERKIRQDPIGTGSAILRKVFG